MDHNILKIERGSYNSFFLKRCKIRIILNDLAEAGLADVKEVKKGLIHYLKIRFLR